MAQTNRRRLAKVRKEAAARPLTTDFCWRNGARARSDCAAELVARTCRQARLSELSENREPSHPSNIALIALNTVDETQLVKASLAALRLGAKYALSCSDPDEKVAVALSGCKLNDDTTRVAENNTIPGRPTRPQLVSPRELKHRSMATLTGRATLIHAIAHIEFNAINLALDIVWRFADTSAEFVHDWLRVAKEEAEHFSLLRTHLQSLGYDYGNFPAHDGLWEMAEKTKHDLLARLALVPRTLEARGLDVSPAMRDKLQQAGDHRAATILDIILRDEIGHVAVGNRWFRHYCNERGLDPIDAFETLSREFDAPLPRPPFNVDARLKAGFVREEIAWLEAQSNVTKT
jgi:uncharacterized ferritin-like protein (DUF455 family)